MKFTFHKKQTIIVSFFLLVTSCAYFNTFYNAQIYFNEAEKIRLEKDGESVPISALDKYGKTIQKCQKVLSDFPDSKFRIDAILLMAKAQFYRKNYDESIANLKIVGNEGSKDQIQESQYWQALCKWKKGNIQTAIDDLSLLESESKSQKIKSKCQLSLAEIYQELKEFDKSMSHLQFAAKFSKDRDERGVIYGQLAEMAFKKESYEIAKDGYEKVIANSLSKDKIEKAHLQILKILRIQKQYRQASRKIKIMLTDDKFKGISGNLELELVQLYKAQGDDSEIETRLESITSDYERTAVSAEAYYLLGDIYTSVKWDLGKAKEYFTQVSKEDKKSIYIPMTNNKLDAIDVYQIALKDLETHLTLSLEDSSEIELDSVSQSTSVILPSRTIPELYYQLGDLESFRFNRSKEGIEYLNKIISDYPDSPFVPKSMFALAFIHNTNGDSSLAKQIETDLLNQFPESEFASFLSNDVIVEKQKQEILYEEAETAFMKNPELALGLFKDIMKLDSKSDLSVSAAYTISHFYDETAQVDSAVKYFQWINDYHPKSDQAIVTSSRLNILQSVLESIAPDTTDSLQTGLE